ncbi:Crp/Fnr family transcriptional regulator [Ramlibacter albus]|uniref:Crp/Fnr family transcriptional regulator n=1 Tax=Ramlibacter albus TaxID=2079448 RepID=A0A923MAH0_9BURK|nr:Crp/Fnr family transcriptional regulator [Ramlibacter albus]MBC5767262.1 Crp/Fnr family transcriptional regulator [Ramlibacter albus]
MIAYVDLIGYAAAMAVAATYSMKTMIPLRVAGIASNVLFITYGALSGAVPVLILHIFLLPLNSWRLWQMLQLVRRVNAAAHGDLGMDWLKPYMTSRKVRAGDVVFRAGDDADAMYYTVAGRFRLVEIGADVAPGALIGELGFVAPKNARTLTFECVEAGELLVISYAQLKQLYFQNPQFGFGFLRLVSERLFRDIERLKTQAKLP